MSQQNTLEPLLCNLCDSTPEHHHYLLSAPLHRSMRKYFGDMAKTRFVICPQCELVFLSPRPPLEHFIYYYEKGNRITRTNEQILKREQGAMPFYDALMAFIREHVSLPPGNKICDVGCGYGTLLKMMQDHFGGDALGLELSDEAFRFAQDYYGHEMRKCLLEHMAERDHYDLITCVAVLEHMFDPLANLRHIADLLKPGGYVFILVPDIGELGIRPFKGERIQTVFKIVHLYYFSLFTLGTILSKAGLTPVKWTRFIRRSNQGQLWFMAQKQVPQSANWEGTQDCWQTVRKYVQRKTRLARWFAQLEALAFAFLGESLVHKIYSKYAGKSK